MGASASRSSSQTWLAALVRAELMASSAERLAAPERWCRHTSYCKHAYTPKYTHTSSNKIYLGAHWHEQACARQGNNRWCRPRYKVLTSNIMSGSSPWLPSPSPALSLPWPGASVDLRLWLHRPPLWPQACLGHCAAPPPTGWCLPGRSPAWTMFGGSSDAAGHDQACHPHSPQRQDHGTHGCDVAMRRLVPREARACRIAVIHAFTPDAAWFAMQARQGMPRCPEMQLQMSCSKRHCTDTLGMRVC
eukprot:1157123-Pelagomonas_calceolata.AAC.8